MALARWLLPLIILALLGGIAYLHTSGQSSKSTSRKSDTTLEPPSGPSPTASMKIDSKYERELQQILAYAGGQEDAIEALVGAYKGTTLNGVHPTEQDKWRARQRGCWMLKNAESTDPRKVILDCGDA